MEHFEDYSIVRDGVEIHVNFSGLNKVFQKAQFALDSAIMASMVPYMPIETGNFIQRTRAASAALAGSGLIVAAVAPMGRYLYMGKAMVDSQTGRGPFFIPTVGYRYHKGAKLVATDRDLVYSNPDATPFWFETAKQRDFNVWVQKVQNVLEGK